MKLVLKLFIIQFLLGLVVGCSDDLVNSDTPSVEQLANHIDAQLENWEPLYPATDLYSAINNENAPFILSVRREVHYNSAHIIGAENVGWRNVTDQSALDAAGVPTNARVVAYSYTGHTGQIAATVLKIMGYDAVNLKFGMMSWWSDSDNGGNEGGVEPFNYDYNPPNTGVNGIETTANELPDSGTYELPELELGNSDDVNKMARVAANKWIGHETPIIPAATLYNNLRDGNTNNDPMILSVRSPDHYAAGHITGAYNIPWRDVADLDNLTKLDPSEEYVVYCYTGHTGQIATTVLKMLGYNVTNLKFGMMGWSSNDSYMGGVGVFRASDVVNDSTVVAP